MFNVGIIMIYNAMEIVLKLVLNCCVSGPEASAQQFRTNFEKFPPLPSNIRESGIVQNTWLISPSALYAKIGSSIGLGICCMSHIRAWWSSAETG